MSFAPTAGRLSGMVIATVLLDISSFASLPQEAVVMDERILRERLAELSEALSPVPASDGRAGAEGTYVPQVSPLAHKSPEDLLDYIRLQAKYVMFDLEATRRENRYLRQMLERRSNLEEPPEAG